MKQITITPQLELPDVPDKANQQTLTLIDWDTGCWHKWDFDSDITKTEYEALATQLPILLKHSVKRANKKQEK